MKWIILDLEATCWKDRRKKPNEIIEIGALCVDNTREVLEEYQTFVQPQVHPVLSDFCTELTSITQEMVANAPPYPDAHRAFTSWIRGFEDEYVLCSWGFYDRKQLASDCTLHGLDTEWLNRHISLKHQYPRIAGTDRKQGIKAVLKQEQLPMEGTHHRGIDDARNINKVFLKYFGQWRLDF